MSITTHESTRPGDTEREEHESNATTTTADQTLDLSHRLWLSPALDTSREWIEQREIECPGCHSVDLIEEVLLR